MCKVRARKGVWVDKTQSNFYSENGSFNSANLIPLSLVAAISLLCMVIVSNGFNFAKIGEMNQAIVTCLFNVTAIYISVVFYFKFGETIPPIKAFGMLLVILCVVFLCIEGSQKDSEKLVDKDLPFQISKSGYAILAVICGLTAPICFSYKAVYFRVSIAQY